MSRIVESLYGKYGLNEKVNSGNDDIIKTTLEWSVDKDELEAGIKKLEQNGIKVLNIDQPDEDWFEFDIDIQGKKSVICDELIKQYGSKEDAEEFYPELFEELDEVNDSLNEARNPENDEVNAILKNKIGKARLTKKEQEILDKYGITRDEDGDWIGPNGKRMYKGSEKTVYGPTAPGKYHKSRTWELGNRNGYPKNSRHRDSYDEVDFANYLTKEPTDFNYSQPYRGRAVNNEPYETPAMGKANRPYSDDYKTAKEYRDYNQGRADEYTVMSDDEIEKEIDEYRKKLKQSQQSDQRVKDRIQGKADKNQKEIDDIIARAKAKHQKNENLNEELIDINQFRDSLHNTFKNIFWHNRTEQEAEEMAKSVVDTFDILLSSMDDLEKRISDLES